MKIITNYNFNPEDIVDNTYQALYKSKRRDSFFAFAFEDKDGSVVALRDHLGNVPLFYRIKDGKVLCSVFIPDIIFPNDIIDKDGLNTYLGIGNVKTQSLIKGINVVPPGTVVRIYKNGDVKVLYKYEFNCKRSFSGSFSENVEELDRLMAQAVRRLISPKIDTVGIYLSGGMDSALVGVYLKKAGVKIRAYTSLPWGETGSEAKYAKVNAKILDVDKHFTVPLRTEEYRPLANSSIELYGNPHSFSCQIGIMSLWKETPIAEEKQIFCGQNADVSICTMSDQYQVYFSSFFPRVIRRIIHPWIGVGNYIEDYFSVISRTRLHSIPSIVSNKYLLGLPKVKALTIAGMLIGHISEGEAFSLPVVKTGKIFSDPYFDMDLIEFAINQSVLNRLSISRNSKTIFCLEKKLLRALALKYLPRELVFRKKGMTIPINRDETSKSFFNSLPKEVDGISLKYPEERLAAFVLNNFMSKYSLKF